MKVKLFISLVIVSFALYYSDVLFAKTVSKSYSDKEVKYFSEIVFGVEYGNNIQVIKKWIAPLKIKIFGNPNNNDIKALNAVITDLKKISNLDIKIVESNHNVAVHFISERNFHNVLLF